KLADTSSESELCFRPLEPVLKTKMYVIWKKYQIFTPITKLLLEQIKEKIH
ncbi:MAG: LysR family transcriptional regulator, partial [Firmicutes bacterium]|nr:LysR family transcriptional regulator [Bacillota bacterium]